MDRIFNDPKVSMGWPHIKISRRMNYQCPLKEKTDGRWPVGNIGKTPTIRTGRLNISNSRGIEA